MSMLDLFYCLSNLVGMKSIWRLKMNGNNKNDSIWFDVGINTYLKKFIFSDINVLLSKCSEEFLSYANRNLNYDVELVKFNFHLDDKFLWIKETLSIFIHLKIHNLNFLLMERFIIFLKIRKKNDEQLSNFIKILWSHINCATFYKSFLKTF